jgi:AbrB family looped-hinge helix DNA binding protein
METTLSSKGQIIIPNKIRKSHKWKQGVTFTIIDEGNALILKPVSRRPKTTLEKVVGCAGYSGPMKSLEEMDAGIIEEARKQAESWSQ